MGKYSIKDPISAILHLDYAQSATARRIDAVRLISYFALFY